MAGGPSAFADESAKTRSAIEPFDRISGLSNRLFPLILIQQSTHPCVMNQALLDKIESEHFRKEAAQFAVGDTVRVHTKVVEGDKERIQIFSGVVIGRRGRGLNEMFTVRRISYGEGVERVFPVHSPRVEKIEVERQGRTRRAELTDFRRRPGQVATPVQGKEKKAPAQ